ncbi:MAG: hypothetical protein ACYSW0_21565 [Planctomycetota bacterium]
MVNQAKTPIPSPGHPQDALRPKRLSPRWKQMILQVIAGMAILLCGIVIGSGATFLRLKHRIIRDRRPPLRDVVVDMRTRYDLTEEQTKQAEEILGKRREIMRTLFEEFRQKTEAEFQQLSTAMKEILSPEQYERWENDFKARRGTGPGRFGPGKPGPGRHGPGGPGPGGPEGGRFGRRRSRFPEPNSPAE